MSFDLSTMLEAFLQIRPKLVSSARRRVSSDSAEDAVQDTWVQITAARIGQQVDNPGGYIARTMNNTVTDHLRRERRRRDIDGEIRDILDGDADEVSPERQLMGRQMLMAVQAALDAMPERTRRIFLMNRIEGVTHRRLAELEDISEEAVYYHIRRALERLADLRRDLEI
ncbi:MAG TPA: sigma-70 family RNA polymerase sigma factor [Ensifer sp.]|nr:sigma-70 family RNA polymerase sigma factor [Ensifer sp.]